MRTPNSEQVAAAMERASAQRQLAQRLITELLIFAILIIPICVFEFAIEPTKRGFFCEDESIRYPFQPNSVSTVVLGLLVAGLPLLIFCLVEFVRWKRTHGELCATMEFFSWSMPAWCWELGLQMVYFSFGLLLTLNATEVGKYTIGRLRPHFMAVCQPQLTDGSSCTDPANAHRYIENYYCAGGEGFTLADVRQARLSFPSGHSSLAWYSMLYVGLYLQRKLSWHGSKLMRHLVQFTLAMLAWFTALSRVMDHWHHWSDVVVGSVIGVVCALITARYIAKFFSPNYANGFRLSSNLQRQDTSATLQEVYCQTNNHNTLPPYIIPDDNHHHHHHQFTKV